MGQCLGWEENVACLGNPFILGQIERQTHGTAWGKFRVKTADLL